MSRHHLAALVAFALPLASCTASPEEAERATEPTQAATTDVPASAQPESAATPSASPQAENTQSAPAGNDGEEGEDACGASKTGPWVGKEATDQVRKEVLAASGAKADRWLYPDSVVTMDFSPTRLNVIMEKGTDRIVSARCG